MREIPIILMLCASIVVCQQQDLDDLLSQIFTQDNSGVNYQNPAPTQNQNVNDPNQGAIPTPVLVQGGGDVNGGNFQPQQSNNQFPNSNNQNQGSQQQGNGFEQTPSNQPSGGFPPSNQPSGSFPPSNQPSGGFPPSNQPPNTSNYPTSGASPCELGECVPYYQCANGSIITDGDGLLDIRFGQEDNTNNERHPCPGLFETCCTLRSKEPIIPPTKINVGCGIRNTDGVGFRITGDKDNEAQFGEFPWTVAILREETALDGQILNVYVCGGSIIEPGVVLTAAHCVDKKDPHSLKIRAGEWDTQTKDEIFPHQDRQVRDYVIHPEYYKGGLFNDIALLFLTQPVDIVENVNVVCLPNQDALFDGSRCFASGWGKDLFGKEGKYQVILKRVELPIVPREPCVYKLRNTRLGKHFKLHQSFICAGGELGRDTCKGDGGSPLVCHVQNGQYVQAGIVSWGIGCGENETPAVYVNVPLFRHWIDEQVNLAHLSTSAYSL